MRKAWLLLALAPSALVWACGGDDTSDIDGGTDAKADTTTKPDSGSDTGTGTEASADSGADDGPAADAFSIACQFPSECVEGGVRDASYPPSEAGVVCCGTLQLTGQVPNCDFVSLTTKCAAPSACASNIALSCGTDVIRGCENTSECTEPQYNHCCHQNGFSDGGVNACMSLQFAQAIGAQCF